MRCDCSAYSNLSDINIRVEGLMARCSQGQQIGLVEVGDSGTSACGELVNLRKVSRRRKIDQWQ